MFVAFMGHWGGPPFGMYSFNSVYGALGLDVCGFYGVCIVSGVFGMDVHEVHIVCSV